MGWFKVRTVGLSVAAAVLAGCTDTGWSPDYQLTQDDTDVVASGDCPSGLELASSASAGFTRFLVDSVAYQVELDEAGVCVDSVGAMAYLPVLSAGSEFGVIRFNADGAGTFVVDDFTGLLSMTITGANSDVSLATADWVEGTFTVFSEGQPMSIGFDGAGSSNQVPVSVAFSADVSP